MDDNGIWLYDMNLATWRAGFFGCKLVPPSSSCCWLLVCKILLWLIEHVFFIVLLVGHGVPTNIQEYSPTNIVEKCGKYWKNTIICDFCHSKKGPKGWCSEPPISARWRLNWKFRLSTLSTTTSPLSAVSRKTEGTDAQPSHAADQGWADGNLFQGCFQWFPASVPTLSTKK